MQTNQPKRTPAKKRTYGAIDGLRALSILAILIYHARAAWLPGGYVGVTVFFVITGFLITASVQRELEREGRLDYVNFLFRRVTRLLPAMLALIGVTTILVSVFSPSLLAKMKSDAIPAALFFENIWYIVRNVSYFAAAGLPSPLTHLWFVGVTMQFYIFWPLVMAIVHRFTDSRTAKVVVAVLLIIASTAAMVLLYDPLEDTARVYYGPDTRLAELMVGALVALIAPVPTPKRSSRHSGASGKRSSSKAAKKAPQASPVLDIAGTVCLVVLVVLCFVLNGYSAFPYRGGFLLMAIAAGVIVHAVTQPGSMLGKVLGCPPLAVAGKRGFGIYLWHYPLLLIMNPATRTTELPWWGWLVEFIVIVVVSELSYRIFDAAPSPRLEPGQRANPIGAVLDQGIIALALELVGILAIAVLVVLPIDAESASGIPAADAEGEEQVVAPVIHEQQAFDPTEGHTVYDVKGTYFDGTTFGAAWNTINDMYIEVDPETGVCNARVILIGDSVPAGAIPQFYEIFPNGYIDAEVGRQLYVADDVYLEAVANGVEGEFVVFSSGDNGIATEEQVLDLINCVGEGKRVYLVTTRVPLALQDLNNALFAEIADRYDNVEIIDWYAYSTGHDEYFWADGTHLRPEGAEAYVQMIREAIAGR